MMLHPFHGHVGGRWQKFACIYEFWNGGPFQFNCRRSSLSTAAASREQAPPGPTGPGSLQPVFFPDQRAPSRPAQNPRMSAAAWPTRWPCEQTGGGGQRLHFKVLPFPPCRRFAHRATGTGKRPQTSSNSGRFGKAPAGWGKSTGCRLPGPVGPGRLGLAGLGRLPGPSGRQLNRKGPPFQNS